MHPDDELPAGWLTRFRRGVLSGAGLLLLATALCAVPAFVVWLVPGADTSPASSAIKAGALLALSAPHGGLVLEGTRVTLTPLLLTAVLGWLVAGQARRTQSWSAVLGLTVGYSTAAGLLAAWARIGSTRAPVFSSTLAAALFVAAVGLAVRAAEVGWPRLPERARQVCRAAGAATACYLAAGALLATAALCLHFQDAVALQRQLAPGAAGLPVALLGLAGTANMALAGVGYLTGPGFSVGTHTSVSVVAVSHGRLPAFPLLAAVPHGRPATAAGLLVVLLVALLAGWTVLRLLAAAESWLPRLIDAAVAAALTGSALAVLSGLGSGSLGPGALRSIGERWWAVGGTSVLVVLFGAAVWLAVEVVRAKPAVAALSPVYPLPAPAARTAAATTTATAATAATTAAARGPAADREPAPQRSRNVG